MVFNVISMFSSYSFYSVFFIILFTLTFPSTGIAFVFVLCVLGEAKTVQDQAKHIEIKSIR